MKIPTRAIFPDGKWVEYTGALWDPASLPRVFRFPLLIRLGLSPVDSLWKIDDLSARLARAYLVESYTVTFGARACVLLRLKDLPS